METINILFCGTGGQGILTAAEVVALAAMYDGYHVKKSEVHGMAQRGGSVESHVRIGKKVFSPIIECGKADYLLSVFPECGLGQILDLCAIQQDPPGRWRKQVHQDLCQGGFAAAGFPQQPQDLPLAQAETHILHRRDAGSPREQARPCSRKNLGDAFHFYDIR